MVCEFRTFAASHRCCGSVDECHACQLMALALVGTTTIGGNKRETAHRCRKRVVRDGQHSVQRGVSFDRRPVVIGLLFFSWKLYSSCYFRHRTVIGALFCWPLPPPKGMGACIKVYRYTQHNPPPMKSKTCRRINNHSAPGSSSSPVSNSMPSVALRHCY